MKKLVLTTILSMGAIAGAFAQGSVIFENSLSTGNITLDSSSGPSAPAGGYTVALLYAPGTTPVAQGSLAVIGTYGPAGTSAGFFFDGTTITTPNTTAGGASAIFEVEGWTGNFANYAAAIAGGARVGATAQFVNGTGNPGGQPATPPSNTTGWNGNLVLAPVPEPSTIALGGLGAAALLLFRRRK